MPTMITISIFFCDPTSKQFLKSDNNGENKPQKTREYEVSSHFIFVVLSFLVIPLDWRVDIF